MLLCNRTTGCQKLYGHVAHAHHLPALMTMQAIHGFMHTVHKVG